MTSNDTQQYLTVELFNSKMETLLTQIKLNNETLRNELRSELHSELQVVKDIAIVNSAKIDMLQHIFYWGFAIMTLVIAVVTVFVPYFLRERKEKIQDEKSVLTENRVQDMISQALADFNSRGKATM